MNLIRWYNNLNAKSFIQAAKKSRGFLIRSNSTIAPVHRFIGGIITFSQSGVVENMFYIMFCL